MATRYIFITGGVVSSLGKGLGAAALAAVLQARGFSVRLRKLDPYLNVDPGTMSPFEHGECYVTDDGAETDLDLGHYERFTGVSARQSDNITTGRIYSNIITKERRGDYLGGTVQVIPHVTNEIKNFIADDGAADEDFILCEVGGTVGDIESLPFLEAIRQFSNDVGRDRTAFVHVTLLPYVAAAGELKTKPTQHSVKELLNVGIQPDVLLCRSEKDLSESERRKIGLFCNVNERCVIPALDVDTIYDVPLTYHEAGLDVEILRHFRMEEYLNKPVDLSKWQDVTSRIKSSDGEVHIAVVGKYIELMDAYKSVYESLVHGGIANRVKVKIHRIDAERFENEDPADVLSNMDGILVPGGFGTRGAEGKINVVRYARENQIPYFGICYGMQMAVIDAARNLAGITDAVSSEFERDGTPVIGLMTEWSKEGAVEERSDASDMGGTMRLGAYPCHLVDGSLARRMYGTDAISERHRHRYEVNIGFKDQLEKIGLKFSGLSPDGKLPEILEYEDHPWFMAVQFHPELKSRPFEPHPLFAGFVEAAVKQSRLV